MKTSSKISLIVITCFVLISILLIGCVSAEEDSMQSQKPPKPLWDKINGMEYLTKPERITPIIKVTKDSKITEQEQKDYNKVYDLIHNGKNFESELIKFEKKYKKSPNVEMLYYNVVEYLYYNRPGKKHKTVIDWCKKYFKKFPDGKYYQTVASYYNWARGISLELYTQASFLPGDEAGVFLNVRKIKSVEFEVYKIDVKDINVPFQQIDPYGFKLTKDNQVKKIYKKLKGDFYGTITLGKLDSGLYVVKATVPGEDLAAATIVSVSRLGVISKSDKEKTVLFVVDKITGAPVENAKITGFKGGFIVARGKTNKDGITFLKKKEKENYNNMDFKVLKGDELAFINVYNYYYGYGQSKFKTYFYADRPVYRPAQKVFFKVIFREKIDTLKFSIPEDTSFKIVIEKPSGAKIYEKVLKTNEFGSVNDYIELEEEAELGWYRYKIFNSDGTQLSGYYGVNAFRVEEYKKPEFKMTVKSSKSSYVMGEKIEVDVDVKYYFGEVVKNGAVEYKIEYAKHYIPYWYYYPFSWYYEDQSYGYGYKEFYLEGKTKTDSNGKCKIKFKAKDLPYDANYTVRVRVTDKSRRMIEGSASVKVAQAQFSITMTTDSYIYKPGNKVKLNFKGKDITGKPVPFEGEIKITKYVWRSKKSEYIEILTDKIKTQASGSGIYEFTPDEKGNFYATITAKDKNGRKITAQRNFYVADSSYREYFNFSSIDIIFNKDFYDIGDKGSAVIQSPFKEGWALVTYEADSIIDYKVVKLNSSSTVIDFNVLDEHSPNFYFSVTIIKDNKINSKVKNLVVPPKKKFLSIDVSSDKKTYKPGEDAEFKITVKDGNGKPVICELSMGVVDASLYYIQEEFAQDMRIFYYNRIRNQVRTGNSFYIYYYGKKYYKKDKHKVAGAPKPTMKAPMMLDSVAEDEMSGEPMKEEGKTRNGDEKEPKIREYFPDTAYWNPTILTDKDGVATVKFQVPDTLTTWRTTIRGISKTTKVGMMTHEFITFKPLLVRLQLPRFITQDDQLVISGIVHNYLKTEKNVRSTLTATGVNLSTGSSQTHNIKPGEDHRFDWNIEAVKSGEAEFILKGLTDEESDGMKLVIPILPHGLKRYDNQTGILKKQDEDNITTVIIPETAIMEASELQILTSGSLAGTMFDSLEYLIGFPYGCVEQTMSRFLPNVMVAQTIQKLGLEEPAILEKLPEMVEKGFKMLYSMQHYDGGWGWWTNDDTHPYMTAYVVYGLTMAIDADYKVDMNKYNRGVTALNKLYNKEKSGDQKAYMAYVMSHVKKPDKKGIINLYNNRTKLSIYGKSLLAMALFNINEDSKANVLVKYIKSKAKCSDLFCHFEGETFKYSWRRNDLEVSTYAFKAIVMSNPDDELVPKIINWLLIKRTGNYWVSTKDTANVVYTLSYYLDKSGELDADYSYKVYVNNREELSGRITKKNILDPGRNITLKAESLNKGENKIQIIKKGKGRLYYTLALNYFNYEKEIKAQSKNIKVKRKYQIVSTTADKNGNMKEKFTPLKEVVRSGQEIEVTIEVSADDQLEYIMIEDYIPAGCEIIDRKSGKSWYSHKEFRDEKAVFFITNFWWYGKEKSRTIKYRLRAEIPGNYEVLPTIATSMYFPDVYANTRSDRLTIVE